MSATWDRSQKISFHYGNAARDLADRLPPDEYQVIRSHDMDASLETLERLEQTLQHVSALHAQLNFLMSDIKRMSR